MNCFFLFTSHSSSYFFFITKVDTDTDVLEPVDLIFDGLLDLLLPSSTLNINGKYRLKHDLASKYSRLTVVGLAIPLCSV